MGLSSGAGVVISQYYGAHRHDKVKDAVQDMTGIAVSKVNVFVAGIKEAVE